MSIYMNVRTDEALEDGSYEAVLENLEKKQTKYGQRLMWLFRIEEHNAEVAGFTSLSESTQANSYRWAVALNSDIVSRGSWGSEDVVGKKCTLAVESYEDDNGREKNKVVRVKPHKDSVAV